MSVTESQHAVLDGFCPDVSKTLLNCRFCSYLVGVTDNYISGNFAEVDCVMEGILTLQATHERSLS